MPGLIKKKYSAFFLYNNAEMFFLMKFWHFFTYKNSIKMPKCFLMKFRAFFYINFTILYIKIVKIAEIFI